MSTKILPPAVAIVCGLAAAAGVAAQKRAVVKGGEFCEGRLLKKIAGDKAQGGRSLKPRAFRTAGDETLPPDLRNWLETRDARKLVAFELRHGGRKALVLGAPNTKATGMAVNFQNWYVRSDNRPVEFLSLSEDPRLIFWDRGGLLNYYVVTYGDEFLRDKDWDNVTLDILRYSVSPGGEPRLVSEERDVRCR